MKTTFLMIAYCLVTAGLIALCFFVPFSAIWQAIFTACLALTLIGIFLGRFKFKKIYKPFVTLLIFELIIIAIFAVFALTGLIENFSSIEKTRDWLNSFGIWSWAVFFAIQVAQVIILPIPGQITTVAGALIFGGFKTFVISTLAIVTGSVIAFAIGKWFGAKITYKIADKETVDKYRDLLTKKGILLLPVMFLFPLFPDDLLCFIAGSTEMTWRYFLLVTVTTRTVGVACTSFLSSGEIIPFSGWGIPVWIAIITAMIVVVSLLFKFQNQITEWLIKKFGKKTSVSKQDVAFEKSTIANGSAQSVKFDNAKNTNQNQAKQQIVAESFEFSPESSTKIGTQKKSQKQNGKKEK